MSMPQSGNGPQPQGRGTNVMMIVIVIAVVALLMCGGICGGCVVLYTRVATRVQKELQGVADEVNRDRALEKELIKAYVEATMAAEAHPPIVERLGTPLDLGEPQRFRRYGELDPTGEAFGIEIVGPKETAVLNGTAVKQGEQWHASQATVTFKDGSKLDVALPKRTATDEKKTPEEAP
jgi:hypothetical protein